MLDIYYTDVGPLQDDDFFQEQIQLVQPCRRERILRCNRKEDRCRMLAAGLLLREGLLRKGLDYETAAFRYGEYGKPELADEWGERNLHYNLSHAKELAVAAFCTQTVGIDVEPEDRFSGTKLVQLKRIASSILPERELAQLEELGEDSRRKELVRIWTRKEAFAKAVGRGLGAILAKEDHKTDAWYQDILVGAYQISICTFQKEEQPLLHYCSLREKSN